MSAVAPVTLPVPASPGPRPWRWDRDQYFKLGALGFFRGKRVELVRGEVVELSPPGWPHSLAKSLVADALRRVFAGVAWVSEQSPIPTPDSAPEPDVAVIPGSARDYADHPTTALLIVEVADSSLVYDTTTKAGLYAEAGHPKYWILDLAGRRLLVFRDPAPVTAGGAAYRTHLTFGPADTVAPLAAPTAAIPVADLLP